ncbi:uncharacterized protein [Amphiura filiformis]|uniref:uncharacterized protein n=1 Tax=Amphiura filiformis TaxID=82378 RepID=UPI003B21CB0D
MASPPHFMSGSGPQPQYPGQGGENSQNDEVVIYFQNYNNRPSGGGVHPSLPPLSSHHHHHHHQHPNVRDLNTNDPGGPGGPGPLNFALPPRHPGVSNEHEAAAYFLAQMGLSRDSHLGNRDLPPMSTHLSGRDIPLSPHAGSREQHPGGNHATNRDLHVPIVSTHSGNIDLHVPVSSHPNTQEMLIPASTTHNSSRELPVNTHTVSCDLPASSHVDNQDRPGSSHNMTHRDLPVSPHSENRALHMSAHLSNQKLMTTPDNAGIGMTSRGVESNEEEDNEEEDSIIKPKSGDDPSDDETEDHPLECEDEDKPVPTLETRAIFEALMKPKRRLSPEEKIAFNRLKHPVRGPCNCPRKCFEKIKEKRRVDINYCFWGLSYVERAMFLMAHVKRSTINRKTVRGLSRRKFTMSYSLFDEDDHLVPVCKLHFLGTLGCQSDKVITRLFVKNPVGTLIPEDDMRGKHTPHNKIDTDVVKNHVIAFCKQFAPSSKSKKLYIPPGITKMQMYNDFKSKFEDFKCGPTRYAQVVSEMNIVFGKKKAQPKPPKASPAVDSQFTSTGQAYNDQQGQSQSFNRSSNFPIPISQGPPSQVIVYPGQTNRNLSSMGAATMIWAQLDPQLYQGQFLNDPSVGVAESRNPEQNQGFPGSACGMMLPPGFNLPGAGVGNPASQFFGRNMDGTGRLNPDGRPNPEGVGGRPNPDGVGGRPNPDGVGSRPNPADGISGRANTAEGIGVRPNTDGINARPNTAVVGGRSIQESAGRSNTGGPGKSNPPGRVRPNPAAEGRSNPTGAAAGLTSQQSDQSNQQGTSGTSRQTQSNKTTRPPPRKRINKNQRNIPKRSKMIEDAKIAHRRLKYALLPPCSCPRQCADKINEERRSLINFLFWGLQYQMRAMFLLNHIKQTITKRTKKDLSRRKFSRNYTLPDEKDHLQSVCKVFFLHTLGYTSDTVITKLLKKNPIGTVTPVADNRGKHEPPNKIDTSLVKEHVTAHQRRTPKGKLRLPPDISVKHMYADFKARHSDFKCGYERYRQVVQEVRVKERKRGDQS